MASLPAEVRPVPGSSCRTGLVLPAQAFGLSSRRDVHRLAHRHVHPYNLVSADPDLLCSSLGGYNALLVSTSLANGPPLTAISVPLRHVHAKCNHDSVAYLIAKEHLERLL